MLAAQNAAPCPDNIFLFQESLFLPDQKSNLVVAIHALKLNICGVMPSNDKGTILEEGQMGLASYKAARRFAFVT
jgi:hypothetical protein